MEHTNLPDKSECLLVRSITHNDRALEDAIASSGGVDAVTIWLIGTHSLRGRGTDIRQPKPRTPGEYRLLVQNAVYELADRLLRPGGVLQVADRGEAMVSQELRDDCLRAHRDQAST